MKWRHKEVNLEGFKQKLSYKFSKEFLKDFRRDKTHHDSQVKEAEE